MTSSRATILVSGIILALVGFILLAFPAFAMSAVSILLGLCFLAGGLSGLFTWYKNLRNTGTGAGMLFISILGIVLALICLMHPLALFSSINWIIALCVVIGGIAQLCAVISLPNVRGRLVEILAAVVLIVFGALAFMYPAFIIQFIGVSILVDGIFTIVFAIITRPIDVDPL